MTVAEPAGINPVERVVGALEAHGSRVRRSARGATAQCPAHPDKSPSLSVTESETGNALVYCHAGCTTAEVCRAIGLELADLFPPRPPKVAHIGAAGRFKAAYTYTDEEGEALFRVVRYDPKTFRQQHPDGKGGWANGVDGVRQVPYHLPQIRKAIAEGRTVWVCEGEKDAENAEWFVGDRIAATCNAMGAGKWREEHAHHLYGATKVVVVADNDRTGHEHARAVVRSLQGRVDRIIVVLPAVGKDLSDHFHAAKGLDDFVTAWDTLAPSEWLDGEAGDVEDGLPVPVDWATFWDRDTGPDWLVEPFIPAGRQVVLYAPAKAGKSLLALEVAAAAATGRPVLGNVIDEPVRVVYLDFEMTEDDLAERLTDMGYGPESDLSNLVYYSLPDVPPLDTPTGGMTVEAIARRHDAQLVVIDTMARVVQGEENSNDTYKAFSMNTSLRLKRLGIATLQLDHAGKDEKKGPRGGSEKIGYADLIWSLKYDDQTQTVTLKAEWRRISWAPERMTLARLTEPVLAHLRDVSEVGVPAGTADVIHTLDELGVPVDISTRAAQKALREAGKGRGREIVVAAVKARKALRNTSEPPSEPPFSTNGSEPHSEPDSVTHSDLPEPLSEPLGTTSWARAGNRVPPLRGNRSPRTDSNPDPDGYEGLI